MTNTRARWATGRPASSVDDNIRLSTTSLVDPTTPNSGPRMVDPNKIKWFDLLRMELSTTLTQDSSQHSNEIEVAIDPRQIRRWAKAKDTGRQVHLRRIVIEPNGRQLPLSPADEDYLVRLDIGAIDETAGTMRLGSIEPLPSPLPTFPKGSLLFVPQRGQRRQSCVRRREKGARFHRVEAHADQQELRRPPTVNDDGDDPTAEFRISNRPATRSA